MRLGGRQYSLYFTDDTLRHFQVPHTISCGLQGSSQVSDTRLLGSEAQIQSSCADSFLCTSLSQGVCPGLPERDWYVGTETGCEVISEPWHLIFSFNSHWDAEVALLLIFELHGKSQFPWLNVTTLHFEQEKGSQRPTNSWYQPLLELIRS